MLTPALASGALMAILLGASMNMPLTAIVLVAEFTRIDHNFVVPIIIAVVGSVCVSKLCALVSVTSGIRRCLR